jgi:hypothetical protein
MKHPHNNTPHSQVTTGTGSIPSPVTHPWWIYRANQLKISNNHGAELFAQVDPFPGQPLSDSEDWR